MIIELNEQKLIDIQVPLHAVEQKVEQLENKMQQLNLDYFAT